MCSDFLFYDDFVNYTLEKTSYRGEMELTRGLSIPKNNLMIINLGAEQWKFYYKILGEKYLIEEIIKTIIHESIHISLEGVFNDTNFSEGEEHICKLVAGQD